jgi:hypothetical protein
MNIEYKNPLTQRQQDILKYIINYINYNGIHPTYREISGHFNFFIKASQDHIKAIAKKGYILLSKGSFSVPDNILKSNIQYIRCPRNVLSKYEKTYKKIGSKKNKPHYILACAFCGTTIDIHKHHENYDKPLQIIPLCAIHHSNLHKFKNIINKYSNTSNI